MQSANNGEVVTKFSRQAADLGAVYLYQEGLFVRAYNEGAYAFIHQVLACKPLRRFVKSAGADRVVCGVPLTVLAQLAGFAQATPFEPLSWRWPLRLPVERALYEAWRDALPLSVPRASAVLAGASASTAAVPAWAVADLAQRLMNQWLQFNVATSTPVAALNLVADLQRQWHEREVT